MKKKRILNIKDGNFFRMLSDFTGKGMIRALGIYILIDLSE